MRHFRFIVSAAVCLTILSMAETGFAGEKPVVRAGLYSFSEHGPGQKIERRDGGGGFIYLGEWLTDQFGKAVLESSSNDNSRFRFLLKGVGPLPDGKDLGPLALVIGDGCFVVGSTRVNEAGSLDIGGTIEGETWGTAFCKTLNVKPRLREHPGHRLVVAYKPEKKEYALNEPVTLTLTIKNVGDQSVRFLDGGMQRGPRNNQFGFTAIPISHGEKALPDKGDPSNWGGKGSYIRLASGETFTKKATLSDWFQFEKAGTYLVTGTYEIELTVEDQSFSLWEDFAVGQCTVYVSEAKEDRESVDGK